MKILDHRHAQLFRLGVDRPRGYGEDVVHQPRVRLSNLLASFKLRGAQRVMNHPQGLLPDSGSTGSLPFGTRKVATRQFDNLAQRITDLLDCPFFASPFEISVKDVENLQRGLTHEPSFSLDEDGGLARSGTSSLMNPCTSASVSFSVRPNGVSPLVMVAATVIYAHR